MASLLEQSPRQLATRLAEAGVRRAWLVHDPELHLTTCSHPLLEELAAAINADRRDADAHEAIFLQVARCTPTLLSAFLHRTTRGQAQGGLRRAPYPRVEDLVADGLRLSRGMTRKSALAGLWWGGGKGVIAGEPGAPEPDPALRASLYREYGGFVSSLRGCYVTAEDAGTTTGDMAEVCAATRFVTCAPEQMGGAGNPARMTAAGVVVAMEAALEYRCGGSLAGRHVALQGMGNVGAALVPMLLERGVGRVVASEVCAERRSALRDAFAGEAVEIRAAAPGDDAILAEPCDVLAPCALGGVLGPKTISGIRAAIVCGPANNPLLDERRDALALREHGITHVPDFVANRMGIVHCANEQYGSVNHDPMVERHLDRDWEGGIHQTTLRVLALADEGGTTPTEAATRLADRLAEEPHPIWGHRGRQIVESLLADRWEQAPLAR